MSAEPEPSIEELEAIRSTGNQLLAELDQARFELAEAERRVRELSARAIRARKWLEEASREFGRAEAAYGAWARDRLT